MILTPHTQIVSQPLCSSECFITFWIEMYWHKFNQNSGSVATAEKSCEALLGRCFFARVLLSRNPTVLFGRASHVHSGAAGKIPTILSVLFRGFPYFPRKTAGTVLKLSQDRYCSESIQLIIHPLIQTQNLRKASPKWHAEGFLDTRHWLLSIILIPFPRPAPLYCEEYLCDCAESVNELALLPIILLVKRFNTNWERCEVLTGCLGRWHGGDWANTWHWTKHFTVSAIYRWPKCPKEKQISTPFPVQGRLQCFCTGHWTVSTGFFCPHCLSHFVSE